jgi:hypothetical protein
MFCTDITTILDDAVDLDAVDTAPLDPVAVDVEPVAVVEPVTETETLPGVGVLVKDTEGCVA